MKLIPVQDRKDTHFVRFIAILLITNSHLDHLYPIPQLGTGGAIGNALFFMLSGYGLAMSWKRENRLFFQWYMRRIFRIYPSLILIIIIFNLLLGGTWQYWTFKDYITTFIWPTDAWFISALMVFYIIFFGILKLKNQNAFLAAVFILFIPYFYFYFTHVDLSHYTIEGPSYFKWIFYLQIMLFGGYLAHNKDNVGLGDKGAMFLLIISLCIYYFLGYLFTQGQFARYQLMIHLLTFLIVFSTLKIAQSSLVIKRIMSNRICNYIVWLIAGLTLEIYLLQYFVYSNKYIQSLIFPISIITFIIILLISSAILAKAADIIRKPLEKISFQNSFM